MWCPRGMPVLPSYEMLFRGRVPASAIDVRHEPGFPPRSASDAADIEREWTARVATAAREGVALTNGRLLRLVSFATGDSRLSLVLGDATYADFLATNCDAQRRARLDWRDLANPLGTSALALTRDGACVLGLRGTGVMHHRGHVHTIGGMFEAPDLVAGEVDAAGSILREVREELGVTNGDVEGLVCRGIMRDLETLQPELMFELTLSLSWVELGMRWERAESRDEHERLVRVADEPAAIREFLGGDAALAPQALAALELRADR